jgi:hypothetical protein
MNFNRGECDIREISLLTLSWVGVDTSTTASVRCESKSSLSSVRFSCGWTLYRSLGVALVPGAAAMFSSPSPLALSKPNTTLFQCEALEILPPGYSKLCALNLTIFSWNHGSIINS